MSGETKFTDRMNEIEEKFNEYNKFLNLNLNINNEVNKYLNLDADSMKIMTAEDLSIAAACISRHSLFIQQETNKHIRIINWIDANLKIITSGQTEQYDKYLPFEEKRLLAIKGNDLTSKMLSSKVEHQMHADHLNSLSYRIEFYSKTLSGIKDEKIRRK